MRDRAVTELLGYVLIFSLVTLAATSVFVLGTTQLESTRDAEQMTNAGKAFEVLAGNLEEHLTQDVKTRSTEVRVANADLAMGEEETVEIAVSADSGSLNFEYPERRSSNPIRYESSKGSKIVYSHGAVFREGEGGSRMIREPDASIDEDRLVLPMLTTYGTERVTARDARVVQVRTELDDVGPDSPRFLHETSETYDVTVTIRTTEPRAAQWADYFEETGESNCTTTDGEVACSWSDLEEVYLKLVPVEVELN